MSADTDTGVSAGLGVFGGIFGGTAARMAERESRGQSPAHRLFEALHQVPIGAIQVPITAGSGAYQMPDLLSPKAGYSTIFVKANSHLT